jgi:Zn-finger nucleic acid-binding protein
MMIPTARMGPPWVVSGIFVPGGVRRREVLSDVGEKDLDCPYCHKPMIVLELEGVEIDFCTHCRGVWLDAGELELFLETAENRDRLMNNLDYDADSEEKAVRCPICLKKMDKVMCGIEKKVRLDKCPRNDGLWFDGGELIEVLKMGTFPPDSRIFDMLSEVFGEEHRSQP